MPGVPYKDFRLYMKSVTEDPPILATETIELPIQRPASGQPVYFELSAQEYCCDAPGYGFRYGFNPSIIGVSGSAIIYVSGGCSPYTWAVTEPGYTWLNTETDSPENILQASNLTEGGTVHISVTDSCGTIVNGLIQNNGIASSVINGLMASLLGNLNEDFFTDVFNTRITEAETDAGEAKVAALEVVAQVDQLQAEWYVKFDINGRISGFGLVGNEVSTDAIFVVDRFRIAFPTDLTQYPVWGSLGVYPKGSLVNYDGTIYKATENIPAGQNNPSLNSYWQEFNPAYDIGNQVFVVGRSKEGEPTVGVNGTLVVAGSIYGEAINASSAINLSDGGYIQVGKNVLIESGSNNNTSKLTITPDAFDENNRTYVSLSEGAIRVNYRTDLNDPTKDAVYKALNRYEFGIALNNVEVAIPGLFVTPPKVHVFINNIMSYSASQPYQNQSWRISALNLRKDSVNPLKWYFTPQAELVISNTVIAQVLALAYNYDNSNAFTSAWVDAPGGSNTITSITATFNVRSQHSTVYAGQYKRRMCRYKLQWSLDNSTVSGETLITGWQILPADITSITQFLVSKTGLAAAQWAFRLYIEYADEGTTFGAQIIQNIVEGPVNLSISGLAYADQTNTTYTISGSNIKTSNFSIIKPSTITDYEAQGYSVTNFNFQANFSWNYSEIGSDIAWMSGKATFNLSDATLVDVRPTITSSGAGTVSNNFNTFISDGVLTAISYPRTYVSGYALGPMSISISALSGTFSLTKTLTADDAFLNELTLTKSDYSLSNTTVLDSQGMVSFIAIGSD